MVWDALPDARLLPLPSQSPTLRRRIKEGVITSHPRPPGLKIHRRIGFKREDVQRLAAQSPPVVFGFYFLREL
jgi:hypothetical protein